MASEDLSITTREVDGRIEVFDIVRRRYVACTPEEWVRQHMIHHMHFSLNYPLELMQVEGAITLNGMSRRCDLVVYRKGKGTLNPVMIAECKQPSVPINQKVLDQACRYNLVLKVPLLFLTNGPQKLCVRVDFQSQSLVQLPALPTWEELNKL